MKLKAFRGNLRSKKLIIAVNICLIIIITPQFASAGWLSKLGAVLTTIGAVAGVLGAEPVALVGVGAECVCILVDEIWVDPRVAGPEPPILDPPEWNTFGHPSLCLGTIFQPFDLPGDENDALIMSANEMLARCNTLIADIAAGTGTCQLNRDASALSNAIRNVKTEYDKLGYDFAITQSQLDSIMADIELNGLPQAEIDLLENAGWSPADIQAMQDYVTSTDLNLAVTSVTLSELLETAADAIQTRREEVPGISPTGLVFLIILLIAGAIFVGRRKVIRC